MQSWVFLVWGWFFIYLLTYLFWSKASKKEAQANYKLQVYKQASTISKELVSIKLYVCMKCYLPMHSQMRFQDEKAVL